MNKFFNMKNLAILVCVAIVGIIVALVALLTE